MVASISPGCLSCCPSCVQCGVIECVPDSKSRDQLGKQTQVSLKEYFHTVYGNEDSVPYQEVSGDR